MFYDFAIVVPAGTTQASPKTVSLKLSVGIIHRVEVEFYAGCRRYVFCRIEHDGHQLYPTNPNGAFATDNYTIAIDDHYEIKKGNTTLVAKLYSPDADYEHTIVIRIGVVESKFLLTFIRAMIGLSKFLKGIGIKV